MDPLASNGIQASDDLAKAFLSNGTPRFLPVIMRNKLKKKLSESNVESCCPHFKSARSLSWQGIKLRGNLPESGQPTCNAQVARIWDNRIIARILVYRCYLY